MGIFQAWLAEADALSAGQWEEAARVLAEPASLASVLALLEARIDETRRCPHCMTEGAVGGVARQRGLSKEQVPIVVAADRSGTTFSRVLPETNAAAIRARLEAAIDPDALMVTDGAPFFPPCARSLGITQQPLDHKAGARRRGEFHFNTVNSRHERLKTFLRGRAPQRGHQVPRQLPRLVPPRHPAHAADTALGLGLCCRSDSRSA